jgi:PAS domain S-box-containing protein
MILQRWMPPWSAFLPPLAALGVQWQCWSWLQPLVWFLFYPAVFLSSWMGGLRGGLWATVFSALAVWFFFMAPQFSFAIHGPHSLLSVVLFLGMGALIAVVHERLQQSSLQVSEALAALRSANEELESKVEARTRELTVSRESTLLSEARMKGVLNSATDTIISVDRLQTIVLFNAAAEEMFGCPAAEAMGQPLSRFIPQGFQKDSGGGTGRASGSLCLLEILHGVRADGAEFPIEGSISQVEVAGQTIFTLILRDISERQKDAKATALLAAIVESSADAIVGKDLNSIVTSWNAGAESMFGYAASEMVGRSITQIIPSERRGEEDMILSRIRRGERMEHFETMRVTKSGEQIAVSVTVSPIKDSQGHIIGASKIARNITEQQRGKAALSQSEARFVKVFQTNPAAMCITTIREGRFIEVNERYCQLFGYTREELIGQTSLSLKLWAEPSVRAAVIEQLQARGRVRDYEAQFRRREQEPLEALISMEQIDFPGESEPVVVSMFADITERKRADAALRASEEWLRLITNLVPHGIFAKNASGRYIFANPALAETCGLPLEDIVGNDDFALVSDRALAEAYRADDRAVMESGATKLIAEEQHTDLSGRKRVFQTTKMPFTVPETGELAVFGAWVDVTERQQAQNELRIKQEHSHSLLCLARKLEQAESLSDILQAAGEELEATLGFHHSWFYLFSDDRRSMRLVMANGRSEDAEKTKNDTDELLIEGDSMLEEIAAADSIVVVDDARVDARTNKQIVAKLGSRTIVNMPVSMSGKKLGVIGAGTFGAEGVRVLSLAEREFFSALASHVAVVQDRIQEMERRRNAEAALREKEALLHAADRRLAEVVHGMTEACFVLDAGWNFVFVNDRSETLLQHRREQMIGRSIWDVFHKLVGTPMEANYRKVMTERVPLAFEVFSPIAERWLDIRLFPTGDGLAAFLLDVHERKLAEEKVRQLNTRLEERVIERTAQLAAVNTELSHSRAELQSLFESLPGLYLVLTPEFKIVAVSDAYLQATMTERAKIIGQGLFEVFPDNPDEPAPTGEINLRASLNRVLEERVPHTMAIQKYDIRRPDGVFEERYWSPINSPLLGAEHQVQYIIHRVEDVTEFVRSRSQAASRDADMNTRMEQMEAEIFQSSQKVQAANQQLEAANKELESFSYSVSHDLRAPLRAMDGFSRAVLEDYGSQLPADGQRYLQVIRTSAQRMGNLIDDLLSFSRLSRAALSKRTVDTTMLVKSVLEELHNQREGRQIDLRIADLPKCEGDPALLKQVWVNLLSNAIKYTQKRACAVIEIGCDTSGKTSTYFVRDNGTGFDMRYAHKLFGVFQRLHRAEDYDGTGVGLAIVQRIIHRHRGRVWAEAALDQGATFYFTLEGDYPP